MTDSRLHLTTNLVCLQEIGTTAARTSHLQGIETKCAAGTEGTGTLISIAVEVWTKAEMMEFTQYFEKDPVESGERPKRNGKRVESRAYWMDQMSGACRYLEILGIVAPDGVQCWEFDSRKAMYEVPQEKSSTVRGTIHNRNMLLFPPPTPE